MNPQGDATDFQRYSVEDGTWEDEPVVVLRDNSSGSVAQIAPRLGSNCVAWTVQFRQQTVPVIETPLSPQVLRDRASRAGVPVLFPFPGRVRNARYSYNGQEYHLPATDKSGIHHIHGVVLNTGWEVVERGTSDAGAYVITRIGTQQLHRDYRAGYPFDFALSLRMTLRERHLTYDITVENKESQQTLPFGFGLHPYLRVPLPTGENGPDRSESPLRIGATRHWPAQDGLPTGPAQPTPASKDFQEWKPLGTASFDDLYGGAIFEGDWTASDYRSPDSGLEVRIRADRNFQDWVLFTPPNRPSLAIEPYTCPPNAINFADEGIEGGHLLELTPGQQWQARVIFEVL